MNPTMKSPWKYRRWKYCMMIGLSTALTTQALAAPNALDGDGGDHNGNGGIGIVCRDEAGSIESITLLDFAEAEGVAQESLEDSEMQFNRAIDRLSQAGPGMRIAARLLRETDALIQSQTVYPMEPVGLSYYDDAKDRLKGQAGCFHEQIAVYQMDTQELKVDRKLHTLLSPTAKAAFRIHEAAYLLARQRGDAKDSKLTRKFVRILFNPSSDSTLIKRALPFALDENQDMVSEQIKHVEALPTLPLTCQGECKVSDFYGKYQLIRALEVRKDRAGGKCEPYRQIVESGGTVFLAPINWTAGPDEDSMPQVESDSWLGDGFPLKGRTEKGGYLMKEFFGAPFRKTWGIRTEDNTLRTYRENNKWRTRLGRALGLRPWRESSETPDEVRINPEGNLEWPTWSHECTYRRFSH